jgi:hypothetical protein
MEISKGAAGLLAAVSLTVGAAGAYLVTRPSTGADSPPVASAQESSVSPDPAAPSVEQSEAVVSESSPSAPSVSEPVVAPSRPAAARPSTRRERAPRQTTPRGEVPDNYVAPAAPAAPEPRIATEPTLAPSLPEPEPIPAAPQFEELIVSADSVIGLQMESSLTSERARIEDEVTARVTRDVKVGDRVAIPAGAQAVGEVTLVERGGKMRDKARLGVRFTSIVLADGSRIPLETDTIIREGSSPGNESAAKIGGGAIGGAIIGGILGGAKGAIIGGSAGAGAGSAAVLAGGRNAATLTSGSPVTVRLLKPATVTVEK